MHKMMSLICVASQAHNKTLIFLHQIWAHETSGNINFRITKEDLKGVGNARDLMISKMQCILNLIFDLLHIIVDHHYLKEKNWES